MSGTTEKHQIVGHAKIVSYAWMWKNAKRALDAGNASEEGQFFEAMNVLMFSAFCMEAFINHVGIHLFSDWMKTERGRPKMKKFHLICEHIGVSPNFTTRPYASVVEMFRFRDLIAHGTTEVVHKNEIVDHSPDSSLPYAIENEWMELCNIDTANRVFSDLEVVITEIYKAAGLGERPFLHFHSSSYSTTKSP